MLDRKLEKKKLDCRNLGMKAVYRYKCDIKQVMKLFLHSSELEYNYIFIT